MRHIFKYTILEGSDLRQGLREVMVLKGADIMHVDEQENQSVRMWASVDADAPFVKRLFDVCYTGYADPRSGSGKWKHIGTVKHSSGLMLHVFLLDEDWKGDPQEFGRVIHMTPAQR